MSKNKYKRVKKTIEQRINENNGLIDQKTIDRQITADIKYKSRIKKRVETMLKEPYAYFFTFTLNDQALENKTTDQHIKKIKATLPQATYYMINNDYGDQTDRLHYHAMASFNHKYDTTLLAQYQYGYTNVREVKDKNAKALYEYILKLTNHATKKSVAKIWRSRLKG